MASFNQSNFFNMFFSDRNSRSANSRSKNTLFDLGADSMEIFNNFFQSKSSSSSVKSCCTNCNAKFGLIKIKKICPTCRFEFCSDCFKMETNLGRSRSPICRKCRVFEKRPLIKEDLNNLKVKDLKWFLRTKRIPSNLCSEKSDLVDLIIQNFNTLGPPNSNTNQSGAFRARSEGNSDQRASFDRRQSFSTISDENADPQTSNNANREDSENNSDSSRLSNDWEIVNEFSSETTNSTPRSASVSNRQSPTDQSPTDQSPTEQSLTDRSPTDQRPIDQPTSSLDAQQSNEFTNLTSNRSEVNPDEINFTMLSDSDADRTATQSDTLDPAAATRLRNSNVNNLKTSENLSVSTESLTSFRNFNINDVKSEDEIRNLSVRQLKLVLTRNHVNYKGCCEKEELQEKAIRLWNQVKQEKEIENDELDENMCKICMENVINCVLLECGHLVVCLDCGKRLTECPICRQYVIRAIRTFKS